MANFLELQDKIGYEFKQEKLLRQALTHSSFANEKHLRKHSDNERLEFLGDAVLEIVSSDFLYKAYPDKSEGDLTKLRASLVCEPTRLFFQFREKNICDHIHGLSHNPLNILLRQFFIDRAVLFYGKIP